MTGSQISRQAGCSLLWRAGGCSVRGAGHERDGSPNQDALTTWQSPEQAPPIVIAAVADGHGAPTSFRSDRGSRMAVHAAVAVLRRLLTEPAGRPADELGRQAGQWIYSLWKLAAERHLAG